MASSITPQAQALLNQILKDTEGLGTEDYSVDVGNNNSDYLKALYAPLYNNPRVLEAKPNKDNWSFKRRFKNDNNEKIAEDIRVTRIIGDEEIDVSVGALKGVILHIESIPSLGWYNLAENKGVNICGVVGRNINDESSDPMYTAQRIQKVFSRMHTYNSAENDGPCNEPEPSIVDIGMLGSRGESCVTCIRNGHNKTLDNEGKTRTCKVDTYVYMYVTDVITTVKKGKIGNKSYEDKAIYSVEDVLFKTSEDEILNTSFNEDKTIKDNSGFIVKFTFGPMRIAGKPTATPRALGLDPYLRALKRTYGQDENVESTLSNPKMWLTTIGTRMCEMYDKVKGEWKAIAHPLFNLEGGVKLVDTENSDLGFEYRPVEDISEAVTEYSKHRSTATIVWDSIRGEFDPKSSEPIDPLNIETVYNANFGDLKIAEDEFTINPPLDITMEEEEDIINQGYF